MKISPVKPLNFENVNMEEETLTAIEKIIHPIMKGFTNE